MTSPSLGRPWGRSRAAAWPAIVAGAALAIAAGGCASSSSSTKGASRPDTAARTAAPPSTGLKAATAATPAPSSSLTVSGVGPGVEEAPFYPNVTVTSVSCGAVPGGRFVELALPPAGTAGTALAAPTVALVVPGRAEVKDHTGKVLYEQDAPTITTATHGAVVLSMTNVTSVGGDRRPVEAGAVNVSGEYACPAADVAFPGL